jgi:hypothetical protein
LRTVMEASFRDIFAGFPEQILHVSAES